MNDRSLLLNIGSLTRELEPLLVVIGFAVLVGFVLGYGRSRIYLKTAAQACPLHRAPGWLSSHREDTHIGESGTEARRMSSVWIFDTEEVGDRNYLKVFATGDAADQWFEDNDPEGVAFEHEVEGYPSGTSETLALLPRVSL